MVTFFWSRTNVRMSKTKTINSFFIYIKGLLFCSSGAIAPPPVTPLKDVYNLARKAAYIQQIFDCSESTVVTREKVVKLITKTPERQEYLLLTLDILYTFFKCFYC